MLTVSFFPPPQNVTNSLKGSRCVRFAREHVVLEVFTCGAVIMNGVWRRTHRRIIPLLPEEIVIGSKGGGSGNVGNPTL